MSGEFGWPWVAAVIALALHVADEAAHDFLSWYNPQALRIRKFLRIPFPPTFAFWPWIIALVAAVIILAALTRAAYAGTPWLRPLAIVMGIEHVGNGLLHLVAAIIRRRVVPGIWSAPLMLVTGAWLLQTTIRF
jgi:hypothetical protein